MPKDVDRTEGNGQDTEHSADLPETTSDPDDAAKEEEHSEALAVQDAGDEPATESHEEWRPDQSAAYKEPTRSQRTLQIVGGWVFGFLVWFFLALGSMFPTNELLNWVFLVVFLIAMLLRTQIENKRGISMRIFMKWLLVSLVVFLIVFIILGPVTHVLM